MGLGIVFRRVCLYICLYVCSGYNFWTPSHMNFKKKIGGADTCPFFGATGNPVLDFWWRLLWVSKPEWVLPYSHCRGECNVRSLRSILGELIQHGTRSACIYITFNNVSCSYQCLRRENLFFYFYFGRKSPISLCVYLRIQISSRYNIHFFQPPLSL